MITREDQLALAALANRAPSVHNIQPTRFRFDEAGVTILEDRARRIPIGDPQGKDNFKSMGAAIEGLSLALSTRGLALGAMEMLGGTEDDVRSIARLSIERGADPSTYEPLAQTRATWRGMFAPHGVEDERALAALAEACPDLHLVKQDAARAALAELYDDVSVRILRDGAYRAELVSWMRLSRAHPHYDEDGLNAEAMALSPVEAFGAGVVLSRPMFPALDAIGLAKPLIAEGAKVRSAAAIALFHRPADEREIETGRRFYRVWLEIERAGLCLCPMSVLADDAPTARTLLREHGLGADRKLVNVFRIGRRPPNAKQPLRARLPATQLLV